MAEELFGKDEIYVGRDFGRYEFEISRELVEKYVAGTGDDNPWYRGASPLGYAIAPALVLHSAVYVNLDWYLPNIYGNLHARQEWESFAPVPVGEKVTTHRFIVDRYRKRDREYVVAELLAFSRDQRVLWRGRTHQSFLIDGATPQGFAVDKSREKAPERTFKVGEGPGERIKTAPRTITEAMCMAFSGPQRNYHTDREKARELGFPDIVVQGMLSVCLVSAMMTERFGLGFYYGGRLDLRLVNVVWCNDTVLTQGRVIERIPEGKHTRVMLEVWSEKSDGTKTIVGSASALDL